jgi:NTE family protein
MPHHRFKIGLALGSGSARGWAHIGVIRVLEQAGIRPDIVCGTSIGALVGASYAAGDLDSLESWVTGLTWKTVFRLIDVTMTGGLIKGERLIDIFRARFKNRSVADLDLKFAAVATELETGREVWLQRGPLVDAVRASMAVPGLFRPVEQGGVLLVDGALVNPVPVSLCRALGADIVIAVDLNWDLMGRRFHGPDLAEPTAVASSSLFSRLRRGRREAPAHAGGAPAAERPSMLDVLTTSLNIMQVRITSSRLAGEPADILIRPRLASIAQMDYHRAVPAIGEGRRAAELALPALAELLGTTAVLPDQS